jgi:hypothetical protein
MSRKILGIFGIICGRAMSVKKMFDSVGFNHSFFGRAKETKPFFYGER